jgi:hypothetical protein
MSNDNVETGCSTDVVAMAHKQVIDRQAHDVPAPAPAPATVRPWTSDFLLPSISFREPKRP